MMKRIFSIAIMMALCVCLVGCGQKEVAEESSGKYAHLDPVELIGGDTGSKGASCQLFGEELAKRVAEITDGKLTIDYHPNGELGGDADLIRQTQANDIQFVICAPAPLVSFVPELAVFDIPMLFTDYDGDTIEAVLNGDSEFRGELEQAYTDVGFKLVAFLQDATYRLTTANKPLYTLEDFKGLQIRTMENRNHMTFWSAFGAEPTPLAFPEVYFALQSGALDAQENPADLCSGANFQDVQEYLCCTNHILYTYHICMNNEAYEELDPLYQEAFDQAVEETLAYLRPQMKELDANCKKILTDGGMTMIEYEEDFFNQLRELDVVKQLYAEIDQETGGLLSVLQKDLEG